MGGEMMINCYSRLKKKKGSLTVTCRSGLREYCKKPRQPPADCRNQASKG